LKKFARPRSAECGRDGNFEKPLPSKISNLAVARGF
jgi:hypothetical protein